MESNHSKGQWLFRKNRHDDFTIFTNEVGDIARVWQGEEENETKMFSNAVLIASAPEMFELLIQVQKDLEQGLVKPSTERKINELIKLNRIV